MKNAADWLDQNYMSGADIEARDMIHDAAHTLIEIFKELAAAEALTRALVNERTENRAEALFWTDVFRRCVECGGRDRASATAPTG